MSACLVLYRFPSRFVITPNFNRGNISNPQSFHQITKLVVFHAHMRMNVPGQIIKIRQPRFFWNNRISLPHLHFGVRSCEVAINWPNVWNIYPHLPYISGHSCKFFFFHSPSAKSATAQFNSCFHSYTPENEQPQRKKSPKKQKSSSIHPHYFPIIVFEHVKISSLAIWPFCEKVTFLGWWVVGQVTST